MKCSLCQTELTDPQSISRGIGPDCAKRYERYLAACGTSEAEIGALMLTNDPTVQRFVKLFVSAMADGRKRTAEIFINAARSAAQPAAMAA